jgi:hypothetical protein
MRDAPLIINVAWGKAWNEKRVLWQARNNKSVHYRRKKEKPRGDGALRGEKR